MNSFLKDVTHSLRMFLRSPKFTFAAIGALGIGTNAAIFSVVNSVLLQPLHAPDPDRVVAFSVDAAGARAFASDIKFNLWREQTNVFENQSAYRTDTLDLTGLDQPQKIKAIHVTADYFRLFGLPLAQGRSFSEEEELPNGPQVVVLSNDFWRKSLGGSHSILGKTLLLGGEAQEVIGVMASSVRTDMVTQPDVWLPFPIDPNSTAQVHYFQAAGRLKPGITVAMANAQLQITTQEFWRQAISSAINVTLSSLSIMYRRTMNKEQADIKPDIMETPDRGESVTLMEPLVIGDGAPERAELTDLALDLVRRSSGFYRSLPPPIVPSLANLVRAMNCYYSNLIEGHDTHPIDIERALKNDYSNDVRKRDLQLEAKAHIAVQEWIDHDGLKGRAVSTDGIQEVHRRFCEHLPEDLLWVEEPQTKERMRVIPGELRRRDVTVGRHIPVSPGALTRFLKRFEEAYGNLGKAESIIASAAAHHRFLWMHPFLDGNGRVARLMSHAMLLETLETGGVWSVARGLARDAQTYKNHLANCDQIRRNDLDGRGTLSQEALVDFTRFFIATCIDQVTFMESLVQPERLRARILLWAEEEVKLGELPQKATTILEAILYRGELPRAETVNIVGTGERQARRIVSLLLERGVLTSDSSRAPLRLAFPAALASRWMPGLFPEKPS